MAIVSDVEIRLRADIARLQRDMNSVRRSVDTTMNQVTRAANAARNALVGITAGIGFSELAALTDGYTKFTAQLKLASTSQQEYARSLEDVKRIATTAQNDIATTGVLYARIASSVRELGVSQRDVAKITETVNLALAATGASSTEAASAMLQLSQAFGSGVLRGEEFNAVNEAAPKLLRILADSMGIPFSKLRGLAEQGKLTTDILAKAFSNDEVIAGLRDNVAQITTISGALTVFRNNLMEVVGTQAHASGAVAALTSGILAAAGSIDKLTSVLGPALKIGAAYIAAFVIAPPLFAATATAMGNLRLQIALAKLEMAGGATAASLFSTALGGVSMSAALAAGTLSKVTLATNLAFSAFVGWEIGKYLESEFVEVEIAAEVMAGELLKQWERVKHYGGVAFDGLTVFARETVSTLANLFGDWFNFVAKGLRALGEDQGKADALDAYAARIREVTAVSGTFASRTAESRAEMEKQIRIIDLDTDRRSTNALMRRTLSGATDDEAEATARAVNKAQEMSEEAKRQAEVYRGLVRAHQDRVDATAREAAGLAPLTEAEKAHIDLTRQLADGKIKLSKEQEKTIRGLIDEAGANDVLIKSNNEWKALQQQLVDNAVELSRAREDLIQSARQEAEQNEFLVETFGMAEAAIIRLQAARLLEQEAQRLGRELTEEEIEDLQKVIALKERSAQAVAKREELEKVKQFWSDIDRTARDTFVSIADGGKSAFQRLKDTAKNVFFDWLYQQTLKKWIINIQANGSGLVDQVKGLFSGSSSGGSVLSSIGSIFTGGGKTAGAASSSGAGAFGGAAGYAGWIAAGMAVANKLFESGYQNTNTINKKDYFLPLVAESLLYNKVFKTIGLNDKMANLFSGASIATALFGRKNPEIERQGIQGTFSATGFTGKAFADILEKGGLFRSDKRYQKLADLGQEQQDSFNSTITSMIDAVRGFGQVLGAETSSIDSYSKQIKLTFGKDEAENQKMIADLFATIGDELATTLLPNVTKFQQAGETAAATLQRIAVNFAAVDQVLQAMGTDSQTAFRAVGVASIEARERLIALSGGIEALASQTDYFVANFLSEAEQIAIIQGPLNKALADLGYAGITTAEQFKEAVQGLVQSGALATEEGAKTYAGLLALGPQFKTVADYLKELAEAAAETADALLEQNEATLRAAVGSAFDAVGRAVDAQRKQITAAYEADSQRIATAMERVSGRVSELTRLSDALSGAVRGVETDAQQVASRGVARAQVQAAIAIAKASGVLPSLDDLQGALSTLRLDAGDQFSSLADYQREVARTNLELEALGGLTDKQLTDAQKQLAVLESQSDLLERQYEAEMLRLDGILEWAQAEVDAINGVDRSVQSVVAAIAGLKVAGAALQQGATPTNPNGTNLSVEQLYRTVLGREGEAAGIAYWKNVFGGVVDSREYAEFIKGAQPELEMQDRQRREAGATAPMSGTMSSSSANADQQAFNQRMENMQAQQTEAIQRMSDQINRVSGGGNAFIVEAA